MFVASYRNTMRNAKPKYVEASVPVKTMAQIRAEKLADEKFKADRERAIREHRRREILARIEAAFKRYKGDRVPVEERIPVRQILGTICAFHGVTRAELMSRGRQRFMCKIRDEAIRAVADARPDMSLPELGRIFGGRDHTTIIHSLRKTAKPGCDCRNRPLDSRSTTEAGS